MLGLSLSHPKWDHWAWDVALLVGADALTQAEYGAPMVGAVDEEGAETMNEELLFHVEGNVASRAERLSLADAGLREREHLQEWILANPDIIGEDILVITSEFDRWLPNAVSRSNRAIRDRLDILGLDATGQLVVAELKRD
jgi:hypothetical protein